jgi:hypothetical protein
LLISTYWTKTYDEDLKKNAKIKTKVHYLFIKPKKLTRHKQHFEIHFEFRCWDGRQMVNTKSLILYFGLKFGLKYNKTNTNKVYSFIST